MFNNWALIFPQSPFWGCDKKVIDDHLFDVVTLIKTVSRSYLARYKIEKVAISSSIQIQFLGINPERNHHLKIKISIKSQAHLQ